MLWAYDRLETPLPEGTLLRDARDILPREAVFQYRYANAWGHGKGSYAGFSDIFRYKLLHEHGGWWADLDIVCLQPLDESSEYVFRDHDVLPVVGNLMRCPKGSPLMWHCYQEASQKVNADNQDWFLPIRILNDGIAAFGLLDFVCPGMTNRDRWEEVSRLHDPFFFFGKNKHGVTLALVESLCRRVKGKNYPLSPRKFRALHLMNEEWRSRGLDKFAVVRGSAMDRLYGAHGMSGELRHTSRWQWKRLVRAVARRFVLPLLKWGYRKIFGTLRRVLRIG